MSYPPSPWELRGQMYASVWQLRRRLVVTAFVDYQPGGVLAYSEFFLADVVRLGWRPALAVSAMWVDSAASMDGGRALWAMPKELATFDGPCSVASATGEIAAAEFSVRRTLPGRWPYRLHAAQHCDGAAVVTPLRGTARVCPASATWTTPAGGPLHHLAGRRPLLSLVLRDLRLRVGR